MEPSEPLSSQLLARLLERLRALDAEGFSALFVDDGRMRDSDGQPFAGRRAIRDRMDMLAAPLRGLDAEFVATWQPSPQLAIAELRVTYTLSDWGRLGPVPLAVFVQADGEGVGELRVYAAADRLIAEHFSRPAGALTAGRVLPTL